MSLVCWTSKMTSPAPRAWTVPAGVKTQSPGAGSKLWNTPSVVPAASAPPNWAPAAPAPRPPERRLELVPRGAGREARVDARPRLDVQNDPRLGLAARRAGE